MYLSPLQKCNRYTWLERACIVYLVSHKKSEDSLKAIYKTVPTKFFSKFKVIHGILSICERELFLAPCGRNDTILGFLSTRCWHLTMRFRFFWQMLSERSSLVTCHPKGSSLPFAICTDSFWHVPNRWEDSNPWPLGQKQAHYHYTKGAPAFEKNGPRYI